ncbi:uncharacterized protein A4U43_C07F19630 [Asparagus officinalis]|uniref:Uncharacterized protein n=1 Tax=Asparagus officinalis TaxID=4686 RepID=A0A5P1ED88_ASPOF|nr:uncharacterized protein A4U43_C07F19630 [Asparagus officinalis]
MRWRRRRAPACNEEVEEGDDAGEKEKEGEGEGHDDGLEEEGEDPGTAPGFEAGNRTTESVGIRWSRSNSDSVKAPYSSVVFPSERGCRIWGGIISPSVGCDVSRDRIRYVLIKECVLVHPTVRIQEIDFKTLNIFKLSSNTVEDEVLGDQEKEDEESLNLKNQSFSLSIQSGNNLSNFSFIL